MICLREPPKRRSNRLIGKFPTVKLEYSVWYESELEHDALKVLESIPAVLHFETQTIQVNYLDGTTWRKYTPDILVTTDSEKVILEVKPESIAETPEFQHFYRIVSKTINAEGYKFRVITEKHIRKQPSLNNIKKLLRYRRLDIPIDVRCSIKDWVRTNSNTTIGSLVHNLNNSPEARALAYGAIVQHIITIDIDNPLDDSSKLSLTNPEGNNHVSFFI